MAKSKYADEDPKRPTPVARDGPYVMMLVITLLAIVGGIVLMSLDKDEYGGKTPPKELGLQIKPLGSRADVADAAAPAAPAPPAPGAP
jgi:hypothetical protein